MLCRQIDPLSPATDVNGYEHVVKNNVSFSPRNSGAHITNINTATSAVQHNSWNLPVNLSNVDFLSLDISELSWPRQSDGSLPNIALLKPSDNSKIIDKGLDVGFGFEGIAPDLGYAEHPAPSGIVAVSPEDRETKSVEYYTIAGQKVNKDAYGFRIKKTIYKDNTAIVTREFLISNKL
ncbi:MAG: hypothetical protein LBD45_06550 [Bacteroidales bacterium]|jgi:hypothetical protein|nr:hypothetical protein [Bacteroidales bacterium]